MSLFKLKPLITKAFSDEEFDENHLASGLIGKIPALALGSFQGTFRLFLMEVKTQVELRSVYQNNFQTSIVSVEFVQHPDQSIRGSTIGILFFRKFAFVSFELTSTDTYEAKVLYIQTEPAFGICVSPLSVMTLNSSIQNLNPREIYKIKVADPIYPFASQLTKLFFMDGEELVEVEGGTEQWRIILGRVRQLFVLADTIIAIGECALWQICNAQIVRTKVMDEDISSAAISFCGNNNYNIVVTNFSGQLFVYSSKYELLWAIKLDYVPIKLIITQHQSVKGMMVLLSDQGCLQLAYSGVQVPDSVIQPMSEKIDFSVVEAETRDFLQRMKNKDTVQVVKKTQERASVQGGYKIYFGQLQKSFQSNDQKERLFVSDGRLVKVPLVCQITSFEGLRNFKVQLNTPYNISCKEQVKELRVAKNKDRLVFHLYSSSERFPFEREISVMVRYQNSQSKGAPFVKNQQVAVPMPLQCFVSGFQTKDTFPNKIVIKSNTQLPSFNDIFPQFVPKGSQEQRKSIKFTLSNGVDCIVAYNKNFNKAKVESEYYSGLCYIVNEFSNRTRRSNKKIELSVQIPLQEFFGIMKQHYEYRLTLKQSFKQVEKKSQQFRNTQKKLLIKMNQKMTNLGSVDKLLEYTYERLMQSASKYEEIIQKMDIINHNLSVAIKFIIELLFIRSNPSEKARAMAWGVLGYERETLERGWEDKVLANSSHFLNKKYNKGDQVSFEQLQKIPLYVISKVNNGDWN